MPKLVYLDSAETMALNVHGWHSKSLAVLHETVSPDQPGIKDITGVEDFLVREGYGIHGMTDKEGHKAWAYGLGNAVMWHCGGVNEQSIGIEQVSWIPAQLAKNEITLVEARKMWLARDKQLRATAMILACWHNVNPKDHKLVTSDGLKPGVCAHWNVSQHYAASQGHTDCWPVNDGGYYPLTKVITYAKGYAKAGLHF